METECDRLASIQALGGCARVATDGNETWCIFDAAHVAQPSATGFEVADSAPQITVTTLEARRLGLDVRGAALRVMEQCADPVEFRVRDPQPDGTGMTTILLDASQ